MAFIFEWDANKVRQNLANHNVSFEEAATVLGDPFGLTIDDPRHSINEERFVIIGTAMGRLERLVVVVFAARDGHIRLISARVATRRERQNL